MKREYATNRVIISKIIRLDGKKWVLPEVLVFSITERSVVHSGQHKFYNVLGYREPKAGEWFLSGAIIAAYRADNDLGTKYLVVEPTDNAKKCYKWVKE